MAKQSRQPRFFQNKQTSRKAQQTTLPNEPVTLNIERLSHDGRGVAKLNGKTTFVTGALPEETVSAKLTELKSKFNAAQTLEIITPSSHRVEPNCPHFQQCGGCELQHLDADTQIEFKQAQALDQLQRIGQVTPKQIMPPLDANPWHYRRRARLSIYCPRQQSEPVMGFRRRNDKTLVPIQQCPVLLPEIEALIQPLQTWLADSENPQVFGHIELIQMDFDTNIGADIGKDTNADTDAGKTPLTALILRHSNGLTEDDKNALMEIGKEYQCRVFFQSDKGISADDNTLLSYCLSAPKKPIRLQFSPSDFTQINPAINQKMVQQAIEWLAPQANDKVLDLFCGLGNFSLPIAQLVDELVGIEGSEAMVQRASGNALLNGIYNATFSVANLNQPNLSWQDFSKILLDPPRAGAQAVVESIANSSNPPCDILYVSCDPATFARDAGALIKSGYQLTQWGVMNMFPHTTHVESMGLFTRQ